MNIIENVNRLEDYLINESEISLIDIQKISTYLTNIREEAINYTRCSTQLKDETDEIIGNVKSVGFTVPSDHGVIKIELPYSYYKINKVKEGDKIKLLIV